MIALLIYCLFSCYTIFILLGSTEFPLPPPPPPPPSFSLSISFHLQHIHTHSMPLNKSDLKSKTNDAQNKGNIKKIIEFVKAIRRLYSTDGMKFLTYLYTQSSFYRQAVTNKSGSFVAFQCKKNPPRLNKVLIDTICVGHGTPAT